MAEAAYLGCSSIKYWYVPMGLLLSLHQQTEYYILPQRINLILLSGCFSCCLHYNSQINTTLSSCHTGRKLDLTTVESFLPQKRKWSLKALKLWNYIFYSHQIVFYLFLFLCMSFYYGYCKNHLNIMIITKSKNEVWMIHDIKIIVLWYEDDIIINILIAKV